MIRRYLKILEREDDLTQLSLSAVIYWPRERGLLHGDDRYKMAFLRALLASLSL